MKVILYHSYFPSIFQFALMLQAQEIVFECFGNYEKQTLRNRTYIYGPNGKQVLSIPVNYTQNNRQLYKNVKIAYNTPWQSHHKKSLDTAYKSSPFYEFYVDELNSLFEIKPEYLMDFNIACLEKICECLQVSLSTKNTTDFEKEPKYLKDYRSLANVKTHNPECIPYTQVFSEKHGFINNLSVLDLLFNEGPNTVNYLLNLKTNKL